MSYDPSTRDRRITRTYFRNCSSCRTRSKASLCSYTRRAVSIRAELTFVLLRYSLGGDRPSQTAQHSLFHARIHGTAVRQHAYKGWYFTDGSTPAKPGASKPPTYPTQCRHATNESLQ